MVRSLARRGVSVHGVAMKAKNVAFRSRYLCTKTVVPGFLHETEEPLRQLQHLASRLGNPVVIPMTDAATVFLDKNRSSFAGEITLALNASDAIEAVLNKSRNLELASEHQIPSPKTIAWEPDIKPARLVEDLGLPLVVKNPYPESASPEQAWPYRFEIIREQSRLTQCLAELEYRRPRPIFQQYVSGRATNVCCFAVEGELLAVHQYVSLRRSRHAGIFREIVPVRPDLEGHARSMVKALRWTGPAHLGFVESFDGSSVWYMETNGRFWASVQGSVHAGWDMPWWLYRHYVDGSAPTTGPIQVGSQTCYRPGDLRALIGYMAGGHSPTFYSEPGKWRSLGQYLASFRPGIHSDVCDWRDPLPGIMDFGRVLGDLGQRALRRLIKAR